MARKARISLGSQPVMTACRRGLGKERIVYLLAVDRLLLYKGKRSCIAYIGTSKRGLSRIATSVAHQGEKAFRLHGVKNIYAFVLTSRGRQGTKLWKKLERAALLTFKRETSSAIS